jgi:putative heme-binding domain-containing protein
MPEQLLFSPGLFANSGFSESTVGRLAAAASLSEGSYGEMVGHTVRRIAISSVGNSIAPDDLTLANLARIPIGDPFFETAVVQIWTRGPVLSGEPLPNFDNAKLRFRVAWVLRKRGDSTHLAMLLQDPDADVRRYAVQWAAEDNRTDLAAQVEAALNVEPVTVELFRSVTAAREQLAGKKADEVEAQLGGSTDWLRAIVLDAAKPATVRALALRLLPDADSGLSVEQLLAFLDANEKSGLPREAILKLASTSSSAATDTMTALISDAARPASLRLEAIDLLATLVGDETQRASGATVLTRVLTNSKSDDPQFAISAVRSLRKLTLPTDSRTQARVLGFKPSGDWSEAEREELAQQKALFASELKGQSVKDAASDVQVERPADLLAWSQRLDNIPGDAERGRRAFFHVAGSGCYKCHRVEGRGGNVGPDLSGIGSSRNREQLVNSILYPSREIAPQFATWNFELHSGKTVSGMIVRENEGNLVVGDADGTHIELKTEEVANRRSGAASIMPENLFDRLTPQEFADILTYLQSLR